MGSYRDWLLIENPNELSESDLRKAVSSMSSAANKRLKRMQNRDIFFGDDRGNDTLSGVKKFSVRGKTLSEVKREFKRVKNFLDNPQSSITGMWKTLKEVKQKWGRTPTKRMKKDYTKMKKQKEKLGDSLETNITKYEELKKWRDTWKYYNKLISDGVWAPTQYDSNQVRKLVYTQVSSQYEYNLSDEETFERIKADLDDSYEKRQIQDELEYRDISTSSFFEFGPSD